MADLARSDASEAPLPAAPQSGFLVAPIQASALPDDDEQQLPACTWDEPDLAFLEPRRLVGQVVPLRVLGSRASDLVRNIVGALGAPMTYVLLALILDSDNFWLRAAHPRDQRMG
jgi:hypothetical protein